MNTILTVLPLRRTRTKAMVCFLSGVTELCYFAPRLCLHASGSSRGGHMPWVQCVINSLPTQQCVRPIGYELVLIKQRNGQRRAYNTLLLDSDGHNMHVLTYH